MFLSAPGWSLMVFRNHQEVMNIMTFLTSVSCLMSPVSHLSPVSCLLSHLAESASHPSLNTRKFPRYINLYQRLSAQLHSEPTTMRPRFHGSSRCGFLTSRMKTASLPWSGAAELGAYKRVGELSGAARSATTCSEQFRIIQGTSGSR